jgi:SCP-2 sterol transfer family
MSLLEWKLNTMCTHTTQDTPVDATLELDEATLIKLCTGKLLPQAAFMKGKMKVKGTKWSTRYILLQCTYVTTCARVESCIFVTVYVYICTHIHVHVCRHVLSLCASISVQRAYWSCASHMRVCNLRLLPLLAHTVVTSYLSMCVLVYWIHVHNRQCHASNEA